MEHNPIIQSMNFQQCVNVAELLGILADEYCDHPAFRNHNVGSAFKSYNTESNFLEIVVTDAHL